MALRSSGVIGPVNFRHHKRNDFMRVFLNFFVPFILLFPLFASAHTIEGPSYSSDGSFSISWQPLDKSQRCHDVKISAKSDKGYDEYFSVSVDQTAYDFYELPSGVYTLVLSGVCDPLDSTGDLKDVLFGAMALTVGHESQSISEPQSRNADLWAKSVAPEAQVTLASTSAADLGWRCNTLCPAGTHSIWTACHNQVRLLSGVWETCPLDGLKTYCHEGFPSPANSAFCESNTDDFWTCDICPSDYNAVQTSYSSTQCPNGVANRCVINTAPPAAVTLSGTTARQDATIEVSWSSVRHANYYQWKFITQSSWTRIDARQLTVPNLTSGQYTVQVRACSNNYGCGALSSRVITLSGPDAPIITSSSPSPAGSFSLNWSRSNSASKYMWKRGNENWQYATGQQVLIDLISGTYTFYVRSCNTVDCGEIVSKTITLTPPASPTITSSSTNYLQDYPMRWSAVVNTIYYEWRINSGSWVRASTNSAAVRNLPYGSSTLYVRACTSLECGQPGSKVINSTYSQNNPTVVMASYQYVHPSCQWNSAGSGGGTSYSILICGAVGREVATRAIGGGKCTHSAKAGYSVTNPASCTEYRITGQITW